MQEYIAAINRYDGTGKHAAVWRPPDINLRPPVNTKQLSDLIRQGEGITLEFKRSTREMKEGIVGRQKKFGENVGENTCDAFKAPEGHHRRFGGGYGRQR